MLAGHGNETSPLNMERDPAAGGKLATGAKGQASLTDTAKAKDTVLGSFGTSVGGEAKSSGDGNAGPPPGAELGFRGPKGGLVSADPTGFHKTREQVQQGLSPFFQGEGQAQNDAAAKTGKSDAGTPLKIYDEEEHQRITAEKAKELEDMKAKNKKYDTGEGDAVVVTEEAVARAVVLRGAATRVVEGYGAGPHIDETAPPKRAGDLVTNPNPEGDPTALDPTRAPKAPLGGGYTDPLNPRDGLGAELRPDIVAANLGKEAYQQNDFAGAAAAFERSLALRPDNPEGRFELGLSYAQLGRNADAEQAFTTALTLRPEVARTHLELGKVLAKLGRQNEANAQFRLASDLDSAGAVGEESRSLLKPTL
jgi:tetratricopeptide (TPR) repeat protein